ncbi:MAG: thiamine diphosphokinase [Pseudomonadota bacterium]
MIVEAATLVTLLGSGELYSADLSDAYSRAPVLVAADGGAGRALDAGILPDAVIGDLDSLNPAHKDRIPQDRIHHIGEQDSTDFDKALRSISAPGVIAIGFTGGRIDHELAVYHTLITRPSPPCVVLGRTDIAFLAPRELSLDLVAGARVSLFPMGRVSGRSTGLKWPIEGLDFAPDRRIGTSNLAAAARVELSFDAERMLIILPKTFLDAALRAVIDFPLSPADATG